MRRGGGAMARTATRLVAGTPRHAEQARGGTAHDASPPPPQLPRHRRCDPPRAGTPRPLPKPRIRSDRCGWWWPFRRAARRMWWRASSPSAWRATSASPLWWRTAAAANGNIAAEAVAKAPPDGYTVLQHLLHSDQPGAVPEPRLRRPARPPTGGAHRRVAAGARRASPRCRRAGAPAAHRLGEGEWRAGVLFLGGVGNISHLLSFLVLRHIGAEATHVPYRGTAAALTDTAAGNVQFTCPTPW